MISGTEVDTEADSCWPFLFLDCNFTNPKICVNDQLERSFGLIDTSPERWQNLKASIAQLQLYAPEDVQYKVLFLGKYDDFFQAETADRRGIGRHGQGWHNAAVNKYGVEVRTAHSAESSLSWFLGLGIKYRLRDQ